MLQKPKTVTVYALFFDAANMAQINGAISLIVFKKSNHIEIDYHPFTKDSIFKHLFKLPASIQNILALFTEDKTGEYKKECLKHFKAQKINVHPEQYIAKKGKAFYIETLKHLADIYDEILIYHKVPNPQTGNLTLAKCKFRKEPVRLSFTLETTEEGNIHLRSIIHISSLSFPLEHFKRNDFLLLDINTYYFLQAEDETTLNWLEKEADAETMQDKSLLYTRIIKKLQKQYSIENMECLGIETLSVEPQKCLLLNEINSGSFLMITPQWRYENHLVEGNSQPFTEVTQNGKICRIERNENSERAFTELIRSKNELFQNQINGYFFLTYEDAKKKNWFLKFYHEMLDLDIEIRGMDLLNHFRYSNYPLETSINNLKTIDKIISLDLELHFGPHQLNIREVQKIILTEQRHIMLEDGSIGVLSEEWWDKYALFFKHGSVQNNTLTIPKWLLISSESATLQSQLKFVIEKEWWDKWQKWQKEDEPLIPVSTNITATLRPYQQKGYEWLCLMGEIGAGVCLADDMGLGKTLQTISFIAHQLEQLPQDRMLILCPGSLIYNWKNELEKFFPSVSPYIHLGSKRNFNEFLASDKNICVTSYATMRNDVEMMSNIIWNTIIIDESHNIKNHAALTTKAVYQLYAKHKIALSGTPIMNNTFDLYAQLQYLLPNFLGSMEFFRQEYANPIDKDQNVLKAKALNKITQPFILRRTKKQVATDLPEKTESILWCEMSPEQDAIYHAVKQQIADSVFLNIQNEGLAKSKLSILQGILKLRQVCCSPQLLIDHADYNGSAVKVTQLMDELKNNLYKNKVLVFSQFKQMLHLIAAELKKENIKYYHFDGETDIKERMELVDAFQDENNDTAVFLMTLKTGNAGINLTAADYVFLVDPWWNDAIEQQAVDRTYRIGQTKNVFAYKMICKNSIEEYILQLKGKKSFTSQNLIEAEEGFVKNLTLEEIEYLFK